MKRKILIPLFFGITIISVFIACQGIEIFDLPKSVDWNTPAWNNKNKDRDAIAEARQWYNLHREEIDAVMTRSNTHPLLGDMELSGNRPTHAKRMNILPWKVTSGILRASLCDTGRETKIRVHRRQALSPFFNPACTVKIPGRAGNDRVLYDPFAFCEIF